MMKKRGVFGLEKIGYYIIGLFVLAIVLVLFFTLSEKGQAVIDYIKSVLRFGK